MYDIYIYIYVYIYMYIYIFICIYIAARRAPHGHANSSLLHPTPPAAVAGGVNMTQRPPTGCRDGGVAKGEMCGESASLDEEEAWGKELW